MPLVDDSYSIPLCDVKLQYQQLKQAIDAAMQATAASGRYILGENVHAFENEIADYCGCYHAVGVASGTDALHLALRALDIGPGDEVITTPFTFIATTEAIGMVGAKPVFVDIDPHTFNLNAAAIEQALSPRTKAILPVHLYGQPCDMQPILEVARRCGLSVIEDCAQAIGARYRGKRVGSLGDVGCFSFFPSKNLGCLGDGGMVVTNDPSLYEKVDVLRRHGGKTKYHHDVLGMNSRLDEVQAAILRVKLKHLDDWNASRRQRAFRYNRGFASLPGIELAAELRDGQPAAPTMNEHENQTVHPVYHQYTIQLDNRDRIAEQLRRRGVSCFPYYPVPLHLQRVHAELGHKPGSFPSAERAARRCLSLPMFPELTNQQQDYVVANLRELIVGNENWKDRAA